MVFTIESDDKKATILASQKQEHLKLQKFCIGFLLMLFTIVIYYISTKLIVIKESLNEWEFVLTLLSFCFTIALVYISLGDKYNIGQPLNFAMFIDEQIQIKNKTFIYRYRDMYDLHDGCWRYIICDLNGGIESVKYSVDQHKVTIDGLLYTARLSSDKCEITAFDYEEAICMPFSFYDYFTTGLYEQLIEEIKRNDNAIRKEAS